MVRENDAWFAAHKAQREAVCAVAIAQRAVMRERRSLHLRGGAVGGGKKAVSSSPLSLAERGGEGGLAAQRPRLFEGLPATTVVARDGNSAA